eukprot:2474829-Prymnesium_polylepis.1
MAFTAARAHNKREQRAKRRGAARRAEWLEDGTVEEAVNEDCEHRRGADDTRSGGCHWACDAMSEGCGSRRECGTRRGSVSYTHLRAHETLMNL